VLPVGIGIQAHIAWDQAALSFGVTRLGIDDTVASLSSLDELGVLLLEYGKVPLRFPVPDGVGSEDEVHFFERTLVSLGVESPYDDDGRGVDGTEEVECLLVECFEDGGEKKHLSLLSVQDHGCCEGAIECLPSSRYRSTSQLHPMHYL